MPFVVERRHVTLCQPTEQIDRTALFVGCGDRTFEFAQERGLVRLGRRRAELDVGFERLDVEAGDEVDADVLRDHQRQRADDAANGGTEGRAGIVERAPHEPHEIYVAKAQEVRLEPVARTLGRLPARTDAPEFRHRFEAAAQVGRQHQKTLDQRCDQHARHDDRQRQHDVAHRTADQHQRNECRKRRQRRRQHRDKHAFCAFDGGIDRRMSRFIQRHCVLADDDRIVDDDADRHDERNQRDDADAVTEDAIQHRKPEQKTRRHTDRYPQRDASIQKHQHRDNDEQQPGPRIVRNHLQLRAEQFPDVVVDRQLHAGGQIRARLFEPMLRDTVGLQRIRLGCAHQRHLDRHVAAAGDDRLTVARSAHDVGDVADAQQRVIVFDHELLKTVRIALLVETAQLPRTLTSADRAGRHVRADTPDLVREIVERHVQLFEALAADEHRDFLVGQSFVFDALDSARAQVLLHPAHDRDQFVDIARPRDEHGEHGLEIDEAPDRRWFDAGRQIAQILDALLHLIERRDQIGVVVELGDDAGVFVRGVRRHFLQIVERPQLLFDRRGDEFCDVFGRGAAPLHLDEDHRHVHRWIELRRDLMNRPETGEDHHHHREIGGDAVLRELPDHWISPMHARRDGSLHDSCQRFAHR